MKADNRDPTFDAVVVGSGATGGWAAKALSEAGLKVCLLEAGPKTTETEFSEHAHPYQYPHRFQHPTLSPLQPVQRQVYACRESNKDWFVNDVENPYTTDKGKPFLWIRQRRLGGRSLSWGRQSYRLSDLDFKAASHDGYGTDWPISHGELAPYYDKVERYVGISGLEENLPQLPNSRFLPPMGFTCGERLMRQRIGAKMGRTVTIGRVAVATQTHNGRAACHYCGPCEQGCVTYSYFSSPFTTIKDAAATGNLTLRTDAVASHLLTDQSSGRATGVAYIDRLTRQAHEVRGKVVMLCASTLESTRLLLNSAPGGLANSSGVLGRYLMDHIYKSYSRGVFPELPKGQAWSGSPRRPNGLYIPRFSNLERREKNGFLRGYGFQGDSFPAFDYARPGFGREFKESVRSQAPWRVSINGFAECLARRDNFVELDPHVVDTWGIPVLRVRMSWSDNELRLWQDSQEQGAEMLDAAGAKNVRNEGVPSVPGFGIHEMGTARMGTDPKSSVLNSMCRSHDVDNLYVTDGSAFVSSGCQNPTLTMMALTVRACEDVVSRGKKGELG